MSGARRETRAGLQKLGRSWRSEEGEQSHSILMHEGESQKFDI